MRSDNNISGIFCSFHHVYCGLTAAITSAINCGNRSQDREYDEKFSENQANEKKVAKQKAEDQAKKFKEKMLRAQQAKTNALLIEVGRNGILIFILYVVSDALSRYIILHLL